MNCTRPQEAGTAPSVNMCIAAGMPLEPRFSGGLEMENRMGPGAFNVKQGTARIQAHMYMDLHRTF